MKIRDSQINALAAASMDKARRENLLGLREHGFDVREVDGAIIVRDAADGVCRVESRGLHTRITTAEARPSPTGEVAQLAANGHRHPATPRYIQPRNACSDAHPATLGITQPPCEID